MVFLLQNLIIRKKKQGKADLEGNQSRAFLKCLDKLEQCLMKESPDAVVNGLPYIETLRALNKVVHTCFGVSLISTYKDNIVKFSKLYRELGISVTPKVRYLIFCIILLLYLHL